MKIKKRKKKKEKCIGSWKEQRECTIGPNVQLQIAKKARNIEMMI